MPLVRYCPCGHANPPTAYLCERCKRDLTAVSPVELREAPAKEPDANVSLADPQHTSAEGGRCPYCAHPHEPHATYCENCLRSLPSSSPPASPPQKRLILVHATFELEVKSGDVVGRLAQGQEHLAPYKTVSRRHLRFYLEGGEWYVEDLGSTHGTYLNGHRLHREALLRSGDRLQIGAENPPLILQVQIISPEGG